MIKWYSHRYKCYESDWKNTNYYFNFYFYYHIVYFKQDKILHKIFSIKNVNSLK